MVQQNQFSHLHNSLDPRILVFMMYMVGNYSLYPFINDS